MPSNVIRSINIGGTIYDVQDDSKLDISLKGAANGLAELDENGKVPSAQLPSYVDDVESYPSINNFPATGEDGKIYIAVDTNITYRWGGSTYVPIGSDLALGETSSTAYRGDRGAAAYAAAVTNVVSTPTSESSNLITSGGVYSSLNEKADKTDTILNTTLSMGRITGSTAGTGSVALGSGVIASGNYSFSAGGGTSATASYAHAEGAGTTASGQESHSEGGGTIASGQNSHSEGSETVASGLNSHAEGYRTTSAGENTHSEGNGNKSATKTIGSTTYTGTGAHGSYSHSEGSISWAIGSNSHAEGGATTASGDQAHAEGGGTTASGMCSHAEGDGTKAYGKNSHSEGSYTTASGIGSHAEGLGTIADLNYMHAAGVYNRSAKTGFNDWVSNTSYAVGDKAAYKGFLYECTTANSDASFNSSKWQRLSNDEVLFVVGNGTSSSRQNAFLVTGTGSVAEGGGTTASGSSSHAEGGGATASGTNSHAEGGGTTASGSQAHAEGSGTIASGSQAHAEGLATKASGGQAHSEGNITTASGVYSHAEGFGGTYTVNNVTYTSGAKGVADHTEGYKCLTESNQPGNHAEGYQTRATGGAAHAEGSGTTASGSQAHAEGSGTTASASQAHAEGTSTKASGVYSHAEGYGATYTIDNVTYISGAKGVADHTEGYQCLTESNQPGNHAEGYQTRATGGAAHAEGSGTIASGIQSHAEGQSTTASGVASHAEGGGVNALGMLSHAEGGGTTASGVRSHAEGYATIASGSSSHVGGEYNVQDSYANWSEWTANTAYEVGDKVKQTTTSNDTATVSGYICKTAHTSGSSFSSSYWNDQSGKMNFAEIIGNGTAANARSNARALDWEGNEYLMGDVYVGCDEESSNGTKLAKITDIPGEMTGASSSADGESGLVPAPESGDETKFLRGDGTWAEVSGGGSGIQTVTVETTITNTSGSYTNTISNSSITSDMIAYDIVYGTPSAIRDNLSVACNNGDIVISCNNVTGTTTAIIYIMGSANLTVAEGVSY